MVFTLTQSYLALTFAVLGLVSAAMVFAVSVRSGAMQYPALRQITHGLSVLYYGAWSLIFALAAAALRLEAQTMLILRWSMAAYAVLCVLCAFLEHEWLLLLPGIFSALTLPFFESVFAALYPYVLLLMLAAGLVCNLVQLIRSLRGQQLTLHSIREAVDTLSDGVLFAREDGTVVLHNRIMAALSNSLCGEKLTNANRFWQQIEQAQPTELLTKVTDGSSYLFRFAGGNTWTLHRDTLQVGGTSYVQIVALNVTESDSVQRQTAAKRAELAGIALQLQQVEETIEHLKSEEALVSRGRAAFTSITEKMAALSRFFAEHYALPAETFDYKRLAELTAGLLDELEHTDPLTPQQRLDLTVSALSLIGVRTEVAGELPASAKAADAAAFLLREAAINAVIHGGAHTVSAAFTETEEAYRCSVTSDGALPESAFTPGGGITGIRRKLFPLSGTLEIETDSAFTVRAAIPK